MKLSELLQRLPPRPKPPIQGVQGTGTNRKKKE
jgi:hypothetical protein